MSVAPPSRQRLALLLGSVCVLSVFFASPFVRAFVPASSLIFEENFTSDNSVGGKTAPTQTQLYNRGWRDGISSLGTGYKFEVDSTLNKNVMYAHWSTLSAGGSDPKGPDGGASGIKQFFAQSREVTMYALVKFHNVQNSPAGAHWVRFLNSPTFGESSAANINGQMDLDVSGSDAGGQGQGNWLYDPNTKQPVTGQAQYNGFFLYSGGSLAYATSGKNNVWKDDVWYEVVWYLKNSTTGSSPTSLADGAMRVYLRPYNTTTWTTAFDGSNFVTTSITGTNTRSWMIGPYMDRWTNDIRHYFSRVAVWSGDAFSDGTLATFLGTPADTTQPAVSMTAPAAGSTVSGTVTVSANATDNVGVTSVQFQLNGTNLGPQITNGTNAISWDTTASANGSYSLTCIARDAAGNSTTSAPFTVTVSNTSPTPTAPTISSVTTSSITTSSATILWQTSQTSDSQVEYGTSTAYGRQTSLNASMVSSHAVSLSGLTASTLYHYRVKSKNSAGMLATSGDFTFTTGAVTGSTGELLLSRGKTAQSSSVESSGLNAANAFDGSTSTRWSSAFSDSQWLSVDLGAKVAISHVKLTWEAAYGQAYQIQVSDDGATWTSIYSTTTGNGATDDLTGLSGSGRYVRMFGTKRGTSWGYSLWEMEVYGSTSSVPPTPTPINCVMSPWSISAQDSASVTLTRTITTQPANGGTPCGQTQMVVAVK